MTTFNYTPNNSAEPGKNTQALFDSLPESDSNEINITDLRNAIIDWDASAAFEYPNNITATDFQDTTIASTRCSIYSTENPTNSPTIIVLHGGGFVCELANVHKSLMANVAAQVNANIALIHYRLSPESNADEIQQEVEQTLDEIVSNPEKYNLSDAITILGYSAGGNLAISSLCNRESLNKKIQRLILLSPWCDLSMATTKSCPYQHQQNQDKMLSTETLEQFTQLHIPEGEDPSNSKYSPVYRDSSDFKDFPETHIIVGEIDRLLGDSVAMSNRISESGPSVELTVLEGQSHNHSCHSGLNDGVSTFNIISHIMSNKMTNNLTGTDGLGIIVAKSTPANTVSNNGKRA